MTLSVIIGSIIPSYARQTISFQGKTIHVSPKTVILDAENILSLPGTYQDPPAAFRRINELGDSATLLIAPSVYWLDDPDDPAVRTDDDGTPFAVRINCKNLTIAGLSGNPEDVVLAVNRGQTQGAVGNFTMFQFDGDALTLENVTFGNYCNVDLTYPRNPSLNRPKRKDAIVQAQIGICKYTDRLFARNCRFISRLNLCPFVGARRSLFKGCHFECTDDALAGSAVYLDCDFDFFSSKPFYSTSQTGAVFLNCDIRSHCEGTQFFTKVPSQVTAVDTRFFGPDNLDIRWTRDSSDAVCYQHNISLNGLPYTIDASRPDLWRPIKEGTLLWDAYILPSDTANLYNIFNLTKGNDNWDPLGYRPLNSIIEVTENKVLSNIPVALKVHADKSILEARNDTARIYTEPLLWGGYPVPELGRHHTYVSDNTSPKTKCKVFAYNPEIGLSGRCLITVKPLLNPAPTFKKPPSLKLDKKSGSLVVDYKLKGKGEDNSIIYWSRRSRPYDYEAAIKRSSAHSGKSYRLGPADAGNKIMATVYPDFEESRRGQPVSTEWFIVGDNLGIETSETFLSTDFSDIPISRIKPGLPGIWAFDVYKPLDTAHVTNWEATSAPGWYYGTGYDASVSKGLVQSARGARLSYIPIRVNCSGMTADLTVEPAKSGGQGFGSATAQYMDICLKFDPVTLNGYALRIERTPDYDRAVRFSLVKYEDGITSVIHEGVMSSCFRTPCHIKVGIADGILHATASTEAPPQRNPVDAVHPSVDLSAPVEESSLSGFCIQHTGSTGPSSTLIRHLSLSWK